ncbi:hypothetical protein L226DRAFT_611221 [Lentinus tigrinus ALCF2SS1-7]|uniref:Uncharacterized protein n=1 Tax=Lentinus tigrinus ALCF2SS1-6 TaxID=1328759 RepID=A0A5C2RQ32_9APHY|nr:hypothetical protein L227DRAFT_658117 [Lentinus tigrinus ALCF2SS1-6]RPD76786.1 hypothetical protein L226DRAFT_611221 [Lentinus tigrinus ALCF2SS1-7]
MFSAFSFGSRPFDLKTALESWATTSPEHPVPEFKGKPKRKDDPTTEVWLTAVETGCNARRVPKTQWPDVAKHFMAKKARGRVTEVEKVMRALHGEQWAWTWKNFRVAVLNMGWNIDEKKTREVNIERKGTGLWKIVTGQKDDSASSSAPATTSIAKNGNGSKLAAQPKQALAHAKPNKPSPGKPSKLPGTAPKPAVLPKEKEKGTEKAKQDKEKEKKDTRPTPARSGSLFSLPALPFLRPTPQPEQTMLNRISAQVPVWLLAATEALATLANDNPDVLTAIATGLVAVGTMSAGGSAAIAAVGEAAVVVGRALKNAHDRAQGHHGHGH